MVAVVVVGGGIAGLSAARAASHSGSDILLLEKEPRFGGRIRSEQRGRYWLNWGAHVYGGPRSGTGRLLAELGLRATAVPGNLSALAMSGRLLTTGRVETYPLRVPMSWTARAAVLRSGARVRVAMRRYTAAAAPRVGEDDFARQQRMYDFMNDRSFRDFVGPLPEEADALFRPTVTRSGGEPEEISAGAGVGYFDLVWSRGGEGLYRNIVGGPATLTTAMAAALGDRAVAGAEVLEVVLNPDRVEVVYAVDGAERSVTADRVVMATPAPVTRAVVRNLPAELDEALARIVYGPYVSAAFLTGEAGPAPWDGCYAVATPKRTFNVAFNMSSVVRGSEATRGPGSSIMVFSPASLARALLGLDDAAIIERYLKDLDDIFPGIASSVIESGVQRWPMGLPYCFPGRSALQRALVRPGDRLALAGDFLGTFYTETAVHTGTAAVTR
ncbi:MAG: FAD-dependent oxidoreductase [Acidimicrobiales bacterium]